MANTTVKLTVEFEKVSGVDKTTDYLIDYFAGSIGRDNGAGKQTLKLEFPDEMGDIESVYEVKCVGD